MKITIWTNRANYYYYVPGNSLKCLRRWLVIAVHVLVQTREMCVAKLFHLKETLDKAVEVFSSDNLMKSKFKC